MTETTHIGFLNLNKSVSFTSHDCVAKIRRILKTKKVGHGGTLDPLATGVLPIAVGRATRLLQFLPTYKTYEAKIVFGIITTTDDLEGDIISKQSALNLTLPEIKACLPHFIGTVEQTPPMYSAIKKDGQKLYELARKGKVIDVPKRWVEIYKIEVLNWQSGEFPELELVISCGSGTYIRAIARDLGKILKVGGTLAALKRTLSCGMELKDSLNLQEIEEQQTRGDLSLIPPDYPLKGFHKVIFSQEKAQRWCQGQKIIYPEKIEGQNSLIYNQENIFLGIANLEPNFDETLVIPKVVFN